MFGSRWTWGVLLELLPLMRCGAFYGAMQHNAPAVCNRLLGTSQDALAKQLGCQQERIVTTGYNYFGYTAGFAHGYPLIWFFGHLSPRNSVSLAKRTFRDAREQGIAEHSGVLLDLLKHLKLVRFIFRLCHTFWSNLQKYKLSTPVFEGSSCCDGEALFVGTVVHSNDHYCNIKNLKDLCGWMWIANSLVSWPRFLESRWLVSLTIYPCFCFKGDSSLPITHFIKPFIQRWQASIRNMLIR